MKFLIVATFVAVIVAVNGFTEEQKEKLKALKKECIDATPGLDTALVEKWKQGDFVEDAKVHEFLKCFGLKIHFINEDGSFNVPVIKEKLTPKFDNVDEVITKCTANDEKDALKNAVNLTKCVKGFKPKAEFF